MYSVPMTRLLQLTLSPPSTFLNSRIIRQRLSENITPYALQAIPSIPPSYGLVQR